MRLINYYSRSHAPHLGSVLNCLIFLNLSPGDRDVFYSQRSQYFLWLIQTRFDTRLSCCSAVLVILIKWEFTDRWQVPMKTLIPILWLAQLLLHICFYNFLLEQMRTYSDWFIVCSTANLLSTLLDPHKPCLITHLNWLSSVMSTWCVLKQYNANKIQTKKVLRYSQMSVVCSRLIIHASLRHWRCHKAINSPWQRFWHKDPGDDGNSGIVRLRDATSGFQLHWYPLLEGQQKAVCHFFWSGSSKEHSAAVPHSARVSSWVVVCVINSTGNAGKGWLVKHAGVMSACSCIFAMAGCVLSERVWPFLWGE